MLDNAAECFKQKACGRLSVILFELQITPEVLISSEKNTLNISWNPVVCKITIIFGDSLN